MAIKVTAHENCRHCEKVIAWADERGIQCGGHVCDGTPPGPPSPPRRLSWGEAYFVRGDGTHVFSPGGLSPEEWQRTGTKKRRLSPWEFAQEWYKEEQIAKGIQDSRTDPRSAFEMPEDVYSPEFASWLTAQYRLAMRKGIEIGLEGSLDI